jgi:hypothetical protein
MAIAGKILIVMLSIDIMLFVGGVQAQENMIFGSFLAINASSDLTNGTIDPTTNLTGSLNITSPDIISSLYSAFVLPIFLIIDLIRLVFSVLVAPITVMNLLAIPFAVKLLVGGTMVVLYVIAIGSAILGRDI